MTRTVAVLLGTGFVAAVIGVILLIKIINGNGVVAPSETRRVEIIAHKGTRVFAQLPGESEKNLGSLGETPLNVAVRVGATITLRYKKLEKSFLPEMWKNGKIVWRPEPPKPKPIRAKFVSVSINAVPWAEVFIMLPDTNRFIRPPEKKSNITPIRGGLKVPIGTAIRLVYGDKEKTFGYESWKTSKTVSHDFLKP